VVGHTADQEELMRKARAHKPDVAIIDIRMPPIHTDEGRQAARAIREEVPGTGVVVLSADVEAAPALGCWATTPPALATCSRTGSGTATTSPRRFGD
jgi:DNA-binding NarL/FixJ family response regulator